MENLLIDLCNHSINITMLSVSSSLPKSLYYLDLSFFSRNSGRESNLFLGTKVSVSSNSVIWKCSRCLIDGKSHPAGKEPKKKKKYILKKCCKLNLPFIIPSKI